MTTSRRDVLAAVLALAACSDRKPPEEPVATEIPEPPRVPPPKKETDSCVGLEVPGEPPGMPDEPGPVDPPAVPIARPEGLRGFFESLARLVRGTANDSVRIAVFGDSNLTMDFQTGRLRRKMQRWFGDAGHGFVALGKPWSHYRHMDVRHDVNSGWQSYAITTKPTGDGFYGLGGICAENYGLARAYVGTAPTGAPVGTHASRFDFFYIARPKSGVVDLVLDGTAPLRLDTKADKIGLGVHRVDAADAPHQLDVVAVNGSTRVVGVALEREKPGVVVDSFGVGSLNTKSLGRHDGDLFSEMMGKRRYDLVVFLTGANDLFTMDAVPDTLRKVMGWTRRTLPEVSFLIVTPPDRGLKRSMKETQAVVAQRLAFAAEEGVPLWDQFEAMGGAGSMARFVRSNYAVNDAIHFNERGGAFIADRLLDALMSAFASYVEAHPAAGCAPRSAG
jgi:lysophospholipase L1-like esterase